MHTCIFENERALEGVEVKDCSFRRTRQSVTKSCGQDAEAFSFLTTQAQRPSHFFHPCKIQ